MQISAIRCNGQQWCACCGQFINPGEVGFRIIPSNLTDTRYVKRNHLVSWISNAGAGEILSLDHYKEDGQ